MNWLRKRFKPSYHEATESGMVFGWWVNLDGRRVADLDYRAYDIDSQFWHTYLVSIVSDRFHEIGFDPDRWCDSSVELQSRFATGFTQRGVLMSDRGNHLIALRGLAIAEDEFLKGVQAADDLTMKWSQS
jgi:hypothetical protein